MDYSNISGFDLFGMPFRKTQAPKQQESRPQSAVQKPSAKQPQKPAAKPEQPKDPAKQAETAKPSAALYKPSPEPSGQKKETPVLQKEDQEKQKDKATEPKMDKDPVSEQQPDAAAVSTKSSVSEQPRPEPPKELVLDMSDGTAAAGIHLTASDEEKRRTHEAAEERRKAEWEEKQRAKKKKEEAEIQKLQNMSDADVTAASTERIRTDVERITRRNMKEAVSEHIQKLCSTDPAFARKTMHPRKSMARCFKYINRQARDYVKQEMEDNDIKPDNGGYGCDVPDSIVLYWSENYFLDTDAPEDQEKEETFMPRPYTGAAAKSKKPASKPKKAAKPAKKETQETDSSGYHQMTLGV